jgi:hypothetical protein
VGNHGKFRAILVHYSGEEMKMLGRLVLVLLQISIAWYLAPHIAHKIPVKGDPALFVLAALFALISYFVGLLGAEVLKEVGRPSAGALTWSLVAALIGAGLLLVPQIWQAVPLKFDRLFIPLAGAVLGYHLKR